MAYSLTKKLKSWVSRQFKKVSAISGSHEKAPESFDDAIKSFIARITTILEEAEGQNFEEAYGGLGNAEKNTRVIPKRSRKNSAGEEIFDV